MPDRRQFVRALGGLAALQVISPRAVAQADAFAPQIAAFTGGAPVIPGRVRLEVPAYADNGNAVALRVSVDSAMSTADHVRRIVVLSEKNPRPVIAVFHLGPRAGRAQIATRVRLAGGQRLMAVAQMADGTFWSATAEVVVTSSACWDES